MTRLAPIAALASAFFLAACNPPLKMRLDPYKPIASARPWQGEPKPRLRLDTVEDQTGRVKMIGWAGDNARFIVDPSLAESVRQALKTELERLSLGDGSAREADAILSAVVTSAEFVVNHANGEVKASLALRVTLEDKEGTELWTGQLKGSGKDKKMYFAKLFGTTMSAAVTEAVSKLGPLLEAQGLATAPAKVAAAPAVQASPERVVASDVDALPSRRVAPRAQAHAVVVGVRRYRQRLPEADFADSDARLVSRYLTSALGFQEENVAVLVNEQAAKSDFEKYFERWLPNRVEAGDEVFVYFSGHGAPNPATGEAYMVPFDGDPTYLDQTAYPLKTMYAALAKLPARKITVVIDSCFSGAGGRSVLAKGARPLVNMTAGADLPANVTVFSAAAGDQISYTYDEKGHGLFTYFFLKAIKETSDMKAAFDLAAPQVSRLARRQFNSDQVPQWRGQP